MKNTELIELLSSLLSQSLCEKDCVYQRHVALINVIKITQTLIKDLQRHDMSELEGGNE